MRRAAALPTAAMLAPRSAAHARQPRLDGGAHAPDEPGAEVRQRARVGQCLDRLRGHHPPAGELLGGRERVRASHLVTAQPPVVRDAEVRVRALEQGADRPRVLPPRREEHSLVRRVVQVEHVGQGAELDVLELVDDQQRQVRAARRECRGDRAERLPGGGADSRPGTSLASGISTRSPAATPGAYRG